MVWLVCWACASGVRGYSCLPWACPLHRESAGWAGRVGAAGAEGLFPLLARGPLHLAGWIPIADLYRRRCGPSAPAPPPPPAPLPPPAPDGQQIPPRCDVCLDGLVAQGGCGRRPAYESSSSSVWQTVCLYFFLEAFLEASVRAAPAAAPLVAAPTTNNYQRCRSHVLLTLLTIRGVPAVCQAFHRRSRHSRAETLHFVRADPECGRR